MPTENSLPCPFCASHAGRIYTETEMDGNTPHKEYRYGCLNCCARGPNEMTQEHAKERWNMRREKFPEYANLTAEVTRLTAALEECGRSFADTQSDWIKSEKRVYALIAQVAALTAEQRNMCGKCDVVLVLTKQLAQARADVASADAGRGDEGE